MQSNWERIFKWVLKHEGGYVNHPADPGGATNKGVTQRVYDAWRDRNGVERQSVRHITDEEVRQIYRQNYWARVRGDDLPSGVDYAVYDFAVNSGVSRSVKYLQRILGVTADGVIGDITLAAMKTHDPEEVILQLCADRMAFLRRAKNRRTGALLFPTFGKGWTRRVEGEKLGVQRDDIGTVDRSVMLARVVPDIPAPNEPAGGEKTDQSPEPVNPFVAMLLSLANFFGGRSNA